MTVQEQRGPLEPVRVRPLRTQRQLKELAACETMLIHRPELGGRFDDQVDELREWLDLAAFALGVEARGSAAGETRRCLCGDVLGCVQELERRGVAVLAGRMAAPGPSLPGRHVAFISLSPRQRGPGALRPRLVLVDRRSAEPAAPELD
jgi:hypothetical protein